MSSIHLFVYLFIYLFIYLYTDRDIDSINGSYLVLTGIWNSILTSNTLLLKFLMIEEYCSNALLVIITIFKRKKMQYLQTKSSNFNCL